MIRNSKLLNSLLMFSKLSLITLSNNIDKPSFFDKKNNFNYSGKTKFYLFYNSFYSKKLSNKILKYYKKKYSNMVSKLNFIISYACFKQYLSIQSLDNRKNNIWYNYPLRRFVPFSFLSLSCKQNINDFYILTKGCVRTLSISKKSIPFTLLFNRFTKLIFLNCNKVFIKLVFITNEIIKNNNCKLKV